MTENEWMPERVIAYGLMSSLLRIDPDAASPESSTDSACYLKWMCQQVILHSEEWESGKLNRWLGYVQGVMVAKGWTTVERESDRVRAALHINP